MEKQNEQPSTLPFTASFDPWNPQGFLEDEKKSKKAPKQERLLRRQEQEEAFRKTLSSLPHEDDEHLGDLSLNELKEVEAGKWRDAIEGKDLFDLSVLGEDMVGSEVLIKGHVYKNLVVSKLGFLILRQGRFTVQCVAKQSQVGLNLIKFLKQLSLESVVEVIGVVSLPEKPLTGITQHVEIHMKKVYCVDRALVTIPLSVEDAARSEADIQRLELEGKPVVRVNQDTRLNNRVLDLRTPTNQAIFRIQDEVEHAFRTFLRSKNFRGIHTPKLLASTSEGGSDVFNLDYYKRKSACLAQSPQLHKQMAICAGFGNIFEVGPVFRAEDSDTHRHLSEFIGLDVEMLIHKDYSEIMDLVDNLFVYMFTYLNESCKEELEVVRMQYPFEPFKFLPTTLRLTFAEGIQMLKEAGLEVDPLGDLNTEAERRLGQLVLAKYNTEFYILHRFPLAIRPFYTMPCADDSLYSNSFDVFVRGEEIISGAQRIHIPEVLRKRAEKCNINVNTLSTYINSFRYGTSPHGGFGVGLERVVMLFCGLNNIRKTSLFPRDPNRLEP